MSYILEALKKSDRERQRGAAPSLHTVQLSNLEQSSRGRSLWPYLVLVALLLNAGLFLWWMHPWHQEQQNTSGSKAAGLKTVPGPSEPAKTASGSAAVVEAKPKEIQVPTAHEAVGMAPNRVADAEIPAVQKPEAHSQHHASTPASTGQSTAGSVQSPAGKASPTGLPAAQSGNLSASKPRKTEEKGVSSPRGAAAQMPSPEVAILESLRRQATSSKTNAAKSRAVELPSADPGEQPGQPYAAIPGEEFPMPLLPKDTLSSPGPQQEPGPPAPRFTDLPASVRDGMPKMSISMLVYSNSPAERMINVNGRTMHEGHEVAPGLILEQITREGAIFSYRGKRFYKGVF